MSNIKFNDQKKLNEIFSTICDEYCHYIKTLPHDEYDTCHKRDDCILVDIENLVERIAGTGKTFSDPKSGFVITISSDKKVRMLRRKSTLELLQDCVGGYIEPIEIDTEVATFIMLINEEGKYICPNKVNAIATRLAGLLNDYIVGDVVIVKQDGEDLVSLTPKEAVMLVNVLLMMGGELE